MSTPGTAAAHEGAPEGDALVKMLWMLNGHCLEQAIHVVAALGIADLLAQGAQSIDALARATGAHGPSLRRLLRTLASVGVFREEEDGGFALTPMASTLRTDVPWSVRDRAIYYGSAPMWQTWGDLHHSVMTGEPAFEHVHQTPFYEYLAKHPGIAAPFHRYMSRTSEQHNAALVASYEFSEMDVLVDVGGGHGATLTAILQANPHLQGVLFDLPRIAEEAVSLIPAEVAGRFRSVGGDMRRSAPAGADGYLIKWVLSDWPDEDVVSILKSCADAMADGGKVIVVEMILPPGNEPGFSKVMDLQMLFLFGGGRIRTVEEFRGLFAAAGLKLTRVIPTPSPNSILEGTAG